MNSNRCLVSVLSGLLLVLIGCADGSERPQATEQNTRSTPGTLDRTILPIPDPVFPKITELDARNATPFLFSTDETADVGTDRATPVTEDYAEGDNAFTGKIEKVTVELM